jgi:hypothetical protein
MTIGRVSREIPVCVFYGVFGKSFIEIEILDNHSSSTKGI